MELESFVYVTIFLLCLIASLAHEYWLIQFDSQFYRRVYWEFTDNEAQQIKQYSIQGTYLPHVCLSNLTIRRT